MPAWLTLRAVLYLLAVLAAVFALWALYHAVTASPKAEARLSRNQAAAAAANGSDAVNAVAAANGREAAGDALTRSNEAAIRAAPGASATVSAEANAAGIAALCKRTAYRKDPRCARH